MGKMKDLTGQKFGKLTVIESAGKLDGRRYHWLCQCECGKEKVVLGSSLTSGNTKSCGCGKYDGFKQYNQEQSDKNKLSIGQKFGKLTIIEDLGFIPHVDGHRRRGYLCECECGNRKEVSGNRLASGQLMSCGQCGFHSKGEFLIRQFLENNNYSFVYDTVYIPLLRETGRRLRFDFIIYKDCTYQEPLVFIEFDGRQHIDGPDTVNWKGSTDTLEDIQERDRLKNEFCIKHNLRLIRIPYWKNTITEQDIFEDKYLVKEAMICDNY